MAIADTGTNVLNVQASDKDIIRLLTLLPYTEQKFVQGVIVGLGALSKSGLFADSNAVHTTTE